MLWVNVILFAELIVIVFINIWGWLIIFKFDINYFKK